MIKPEARDPASAPTRCRCNNNNNNNNNTNCNINSIHNSINSNNDINL